MLQFASIKGDNMNINVEKIKKLLALGTTFAIVTTVAVYTEMKNNNYNAKIVETSSITTESNVYACFNGFVLNNEENNKKIQVSYEDFFSIRTSQR